MDPLMKTIEEKILAAMERGEFDNLPGKGHPLDLQEDAHVPADLRMAYRIMKRANVPPEEVLLTKSLGVLKAKLLELEETAPSEQRREELEALRKKIRLLEPEVLMKLERFKKLHYR